MITLFFLAVVIFLELIQYLVIFDVILSWLALAGIQFRPQFMRSILDPLYEFVRKYIPSKLGMFDFTPIIIIFACLFLSSIIASNVAGVSEMISQITNR